MDKSEGKDFFSKTFSSLTDKVAKLYGTGRKKVSLLSMNNAYAEKLAALGSKAFQLLNEGKSVTKETVKAEYLSLTKMKREIAKAEEEYQAMKTELGKKSDESKSVSETDESKKRVKAKGKTAKKGDRAKGKTSQRTRGRKRSVKSSVVD